MIIESAPVARVTAACLSMALAALKDAASSFLSPQQLLHCQPSLNIFTLSCLVVFLIRFS
jgi:hypothetical protein